MEPSRLSAAPKRPCALGESSQNLQASGNEPTHAAMVAGYRAEINIPQERTLAKLVATQ